MVVQGVRAWPFQGSGSNSESLRFLDLVASCQGLASQLSAILGIDFDVSAGQPVSHTLNDPYASDYPTALKFQPKGFSWDTWRRRSLCAD